MVCKVYWLVKWVFFLGVQFENLEAHTLSFIAPRLHVVVGSQPRRVVQHNTANLRALLGACEIQGA